MGRTEQEVIQEDTSPMDEGTHHRLWARECYGKIMKDKIRIGSGGSDMGVKDDTAKCDKVMDTGVGAVLIAAEYMNGVVVEPPWLNYERKWGNSENIKDDLSGLDKAIGAVLGQRTIERNQLLVSIAKSKLSKSRDEKNEKVIKPEELVRLYDLLLQNTADLSDLLSSGRDRKEEEVALSEECELKTLAFRAERALLSETNEFVGEKIAYALSQGLKVVACVGETLAQREAGTTMEVVAAQTQAIVNALAPGSLQCQTSFLIYLSLLRPVASSYTTHIESSHAALSSLWDNVVLAYEPVWATGTGKVASPEQAQVVS
ncbi:signal recognition particle subunit SRP68 [Tanacetum coccineum]